MEELGPLVTEAYAGIAPESRPARVEYRGTVASTSNDVELLEAEMLAELGRGRQREIERGMSLVGPHRDDLLLHLGDAPAKGFASHGETWSYAIALRLAEFTLLRREGSDPVLVLDDVFSELDAKRREKLVDLAADAEQVLITAAVDADLPPNITAAAKKHLVTVRDTEEGRISELG